MRKSNIKIKKGQIWRSKSKNYCILVGDKIKDDFWRVYPHNKQNCHKMQEHSFHFYDLIDTRLNT